MRFSSNKSDHSKDPEPTVLRPYHEQNGPGSSLFHFKVTPPAPRKGTPRSPLPLNISENCLQSDLTVALW